MDGDLSDEVAFGKGSCDWWQAVVGSMSAIKMQNQRGYMPQWRKRL